ncbi:MAG: HAMP domain-containing histidine kinase [Alphaproteobacteria bacterium]|nr:HAMP domain-containing histidine kinase [Alphaproteobacteria bacterium]MBL7098744.1 HAMP domain-containing histidine kinase [Alphaproteobacteria bacterium]
MVREKLIATLWWSALCIAGAMASDYVITILILDDWAAYTPLVTLATATVVTLPVSYALVSSRYDLRRARDELAAARDIAVNADKNKTLFFSNMTHELRTPLNAIIAFSEMLGSELFAPKRVEYARLIHSSGTHLLSLVNDLLDLSRIEDGRLELHDEVLDLDVLMRDCIETVSARARGREVRLACSIPQQLPLVRADQRALKQIVLNLLTNAIKFSHPGGIVEAFARLEADGIVFGVEDYGVGIAPENHARVFERFGQVRQEISGIEKGTGLGLPIVKGLAEAHGGAVSLSSKLGEGTSIAVTLAAERIVPRVAVALAS